LAKGQTFYRKLRFWLWTSKTEKKVTYLQGCW